MEALMEVLRPIAEAYLGNFGWALQVLSIVGTFRLIFKPLLAGIKGVIEATPTKKDDEVVAKVEASPYWKWFLFGLDWLASIKLTPKPKA